MKTVYFDTVLLIERLHRLFLELVKGELDALRIKDINNIQGLLLYNIGLRKLTVGELTSKGYYLGSNVSYNLRKMVQNGYVIQELASHDKRSSFVSLSEKGYSLYQKLDTILEKQTKHFQSEIKDAAILNKTKKGLQSLEVIWEQALLKGFRVSETPSL